MVYEFELKGRMANVMRSKDW